MFNVVLMIASLVLCFSLEIIVYKFFKKEGLYVWIAVASILANILICKQVDIINNPICLGSILFGSNFLATDILTIKYNKKVATKGIILGLIAVLGYIITTQIGLAFKPSDIDISQSSMYNLFTISARVSIASVSMYFISNLIDIHIFDKLIKKSNKIWLSNNLATIISNVGENFLFGFLAFAGVFSFKELLLMQIAGSILEIIIALCDTPFLYIAKKIGANNESRV